ncbi:MAG: SurA N-terminal domain-containing protein [Desulfobacteraceae bacterium]|jgi:peptidyl-prolyl cis-trans isomerase D
MLSLMRKHAGTWMIKIILGAIVIVFVFWGVGSYRSRQTGRVADVNGTVITLNDYRNTYTNLVEQARQSFGNSLNDELIQALQLRRRALDQLVDRALMLQAAEKLNIQVSDEELAQAIKNFPAFQTAGVFDNQRYLNILSRTKLSPETFEEQQREALVIDRLQNFVAGNIKVSDLEAQQWYKWNNTKVDLDYVLFEPGQFKNIQPTADEIQEFFDQHKESYKTDPEIRVRYLNLKPEDFEAGVTVTAEDIRDYYESNTEKFKEPKTVQARHILIKVDQNAKPEAVESARQRAEDVLKLAKEGQDFAALARQYSEGPTKTKGGDLGTFRREAMVKPFADKAFSLKAGDISEPVRTRFGWHIIKVEKVNPAKTRSLDEARNEIEKTLQTDRARNLAYDEAENVYDATFEGRDLVDIAQERNLKIMTTKLFTQKSPPEEIKDAARFASVAFSLPVGEASDIQEFSDGYYLIEVVETVPSKIPELKAVEDIVKTDVIREKQDAKALSEANRFLAELKNGQSFDAASQKFKSAPKKTGFFKRNDSIPTIGREPEIAQKAFKLSEQDRLPGESLKGQKGYYVIRLRERQEPDLNGFEKEKAAVMERLLQQKTFKTMDAWLKRIKNESQISIEEGFWQS